MRATTIRHVMAFLLVAVTIPCAVTVRAQDAVAERFPGLVATPERDFIWQWGDFQRTGAGLGPHIMLNGTDQGFSCDVNVRLRALGRLSTAERVQIERDIESGTSFIRAAVDALNFLDQRRDLDWGELRCERETRAEADRQRDAMIEERLRRRNRPQR